MKRLEEYTIDEIIENFNKLYHMAEDMFNYVKENGTSGDNDDGQWCFEAIMNLLGDDIWKEYNRFLT